MKPVMKKKCVTCPFRTDAEGKHPDVRLVDTIINKLWRASQICHHPRLKGKPETHICRGARDIQLTIWHRLGILAKPTDKAWGTALAKKNQY